jgi:hypothetical protein
MLLASYERVDIVGADGVLAEIEALTEKVGLPYQRWQHGQYVSGRLLLAGKAFEAETANERLLELGTAADVPQALSTFGGILRGIREHQGRLDEVADFFVDAARDNPSVAALPSAVVSLLCELGRIDEASVQLAAEAATGFDFPYDGTWLASMSNLIDAPPRSKTPPRPVHLSSASRPSQPIIAIGGVKVNGAIARPLARAATLLGDYDQAEQWFATAHDIHNRLRTPYWTALGQLDHAETSASPDTRRVISNVPATSQAPPQRPQTIMAAPDSPNELQHSSPPSEAYRKL